MARGKTLFAASQYRTAEMQKESNEALGKLGLKDALTVKTSEVQAEELAKENDLAEMFQDSIQLQLAVAQRRWIRSRRALQSLQIGIGRLARADSRWKEPGMSTAAQPLIRLESLRKVFYTDEVETHALSGVRLEIKTGEFVSRGKERKFVPLQAEGTSFPVACLAPRDFKLRNKAGSSKRPSKPAPSSMPGLLAP